jgi:hypothetical protein
MNITSNKIMKFCTVKILKVNNKEDSKHAKLMTTEIHMNFHHKIGKLIELLALKVLIIINYRIFHWQKQKMCCRVAEQLR